MFLPRITPSWATDTARTPSRRQNLPNVNARLPTANSTVVVITTSCSVASSSSKITYRNEDFHIRTASTRQCGKEHETTCCDRVMPPLFAGSEETEALRRRVDTSRRCTPQHTDVSSCPNLNNHALKLIPSA